MTPLPSTPVPDRAGLGRPAGPDFRPGNEPPCRRRAAAHVMPPPAAAAPVSRPDADRQRPSRTAVVPAAFPIPGTTAPPPQPGPPSPRRSSRAGVAGLALLAVV